MNIATHSGVGPFSIKLLATGLALLLSACGGGGGSGSEANTAPVLTGLIDFAVDENTTEVATFQASDADGDVISYSINGQDAGAFSIGGQSGVLVFRDSPDFENPADEDQDNLYQLSVVASDGQLSASLGIVVTVNDVLEGEGGFNMVLMGNSFFRPYAQELGEMALAAGFTEHRDTGFFAGGDNGRPTNLWQANNALTAEIKAALDEGDVDMFGMTAGVIPENPTEGFREWINYAVAANPNVTVFLSLPPPDYPEQWQERAEALGYTNIREAYDAEVLQLVHSEIIDVLRAEFPSTKIFSVPTYGATFELADLYEQGLLEDEIGFRGPRPESLFTDEKGHQGEIIITTGTLIWLGELYDVDLGAFEFDTGFNTDLHSIAEGVISAHDPNY